MKYTFSGARILIADDNSQGCELLEAYLADTECDYRIATNGEEVLHVVADWQPHIILLDVMMPKLSGFEVCKAIRSNPTTAKIGIIMVTALDQQSDIDRAVDVGTDDFLTKPIDRLDLLIRIQAMLSSLGQQNDMERSLQYIAAVDAGGH
ncbi:MAG: response regulator [Zavarzinella sp.]